MSNNINTMMTGAVDHLSAALAALHDLSKTDLPESAKDAIERVSVSVRDAAIAAVDIIPTVCGEG